MSALESRLDRLEQSNLKANGGVIVVSWYGPQDDERVQQAEDDAKASGAQVVVFRIIYEERSSA
jgi:hypothetical protein